MRIALAVLGLACMAHPARADTPCWQIVPTQEASMVTTPLNLLINQCTGQTFQLVRVTTPDNDAWGYSWAPVPMTDRPLVTAASPAPKLPSKK